MTQYIDKAAIIAEIEKLESRFQNGDDEEYADGYHYSLKLVKRILDTLEVKEVDSDDAVSATIDFPLIGYDFPNIYPNYKELKEYCIRHCIKDNDKVKITIDKEK